MVHCAIWYHEYGLHECFSRFLNCANGTKSRNASHIIETKVNIWDSQKVTISKSNTVVKEVFQITLNFFVQYLKSNSLHVETKVTLSGSHQNTLRVTNIQDIQLAMCKKCPYSELFWSVFSRIWTEYGEILSIHVITS